MHQHRVQFRGRVDGPFLIGDRQGRIVIRHLVHREDDGRPVHVFASLPSFLRDRAAGIDGGAVARFEGIPAPRYSCPDTRADGAEVAVREAIWLTDLTDLTGWTEGREPGPGPSKDEAAYYGMALPEWLEGAEAPAPLPIAA